MSSFLWLFLVFTVSIVFIVLLAVPVFSTVNLLFTRNVFPTASLINKYRRIEILRKNCKVPRCLSSYLLRSKNTRSWKTSCSRVNVISLID